MKINNYQDVAAKELVTGVTMRVVAGPEHGAPTFAMRLFELQPGSSTPQHSHDWEHEVFVIAGRGILRSAEGELKLGEGDAVLVPPGEQHCFANTGNAVLRLICVVPLIGGQMPGTPPAD